MKSHLRITIDTLLKSGTPQREIERRIGVSRKTIRRYAPRARQIPPGWPPAPAAAARPVSTPSACEPHRTWIEAQVSLGRNAVAIYQDLVEGQGLRCNQIPKTLISTNTVFKVPAI